MNDPVFIIVGILTMTAVPILAWILTREMRAKAAFKAGILRLLHESAPAGFKISDEHFGTDQEAAIALDRDTGHFLLWQKKTNRVQGYPAEAITAIEICKTDNRTKLQLRLELDDANNPDVSLCFGWRSKKNSDATRQRKAKALDWKALLQNGLGLEGDSSSQEATDLRRVVKRNKIAGYLSIFGGIAAVVAHFGVFHTLRGGKLSGLVGCLVGYGIGYQIARLIVPVAKREDSYV